MQYDAIAIIVIYYVTVILVLYSTITYKLLCLFIVVVVIHQYTIYLYIIDIFCCHSSNGTEKTFGPDGDSTDLTDLRGADAV
jgi:hypothetical protein